MVFLSLCLVWINAIVVFDSIDFHNLHVDNYAIAILFHMHNTLYKRTNQVKKKETELNDYDLISIENGQNEYTYMHQ